MIKKSCAVIAIISTFLLASCSYKEENAQITTMNMQRQENMAMALSSAKTSEAVVAMSILFAIGAGQQKLFQPQSALDYIHGAFPYVSLILPILSRGSGGDTRSVQSGRDIYINATNNHDSISSGVQDYFVTGPVYSNDLSEE